MSDEQEDIPVGRLATPWEEFLLGQARESFKQSVPSLNDVLGKLLTLNTALIGAGIVALKEQILPFWGGVVAIALVLASLGATLAGLFPHSWTVRPNDPDEIYRIERAVAEWKTWCLRLAFGGLGAGLLASLLSLVIARI